MAGFGRTAGVVLGALVLLLGAAHAQDEEGGGLNALVDRVSERLDAALGDEPPADDDRFRTIEPARAEGERSTVAAAVMGAAVEGVDRIKLTVTMPGSGPRLLLVDAGAVFRAPDGAAYVLCPNQKFLLEAASTEVEAEALPLKGDQEAPAPGTALKALKSNDPGVIAVLRAAQRLEGEDTQRLSRYISEKEGAPKVDTFLDNQDVRLARRMSWSRNVVGKLEGRLPRDDIRFALLAVTDGYTITQTVDWLRLHRKLEMQPAIDLAWEIVPGIEYLLERATLRHRTFSPRHAEYHFNQGVAAFARGDLDAAQKAFEAALEKQAGMVEAQYNLGVVLYRKGDYEGAKGVFLVASGMDGAPADAAYNRGAAEYRLGDKLAAARAFRAALAINDKHTEAAAWLEKADPEGKTAPPPPPPEKKGRGGRKPK
ncbi:MAG: tetratricopeptide repeat protein [bacterium]